MTTNGRRRALTPLLLLMLVAVASFPAARAAAAAGADQFYTLASIQTATLDRGEVVLKLTANGPIAYRIVDDDANPTPGTLHLKLYGVDASTLGSTVATEVGSIDVTPDGHGNLDAVLHPAGAFAAKALRVTTGRRANELEIRVSPSPAGQ